MSSLPDSLATLDVRPNTWLRRPRRCRVHAVGATCFALAFVGLFVWAWIWRPPAHDELPAAIAGSALWIFIFCTPALLFARRIARAGMWMGPEEVVVRGPLRTWRIPLEEVRGFGPGVQPGYGPNGTPCPMLTREGGRPVGVWALGREGVVWSYDRYLSEFEPLCDELNGLLGRLRAEAGIAEPPGFGQAAGTPVASAR